MTEDLAVILARKKAALLASLSDNQEQQTQQSIQQSTETSSLDTNEAPEQQTALSKRQQRRQKQKQVKEHLKEKERYWNEQTFKNVKLSMERVKEELIQEEKDLEKQQREEKEKRPETEDVSNETEKELSNKERKKLTRPTVAYLKSIAAKPELVEAHDCNSPEPQLLVYLKSLQNAVPVPTHWSQKRKFLDNKKIYDKPIFKLPPFIEATGISEMRVTHEAETDAKALRKEMRERTRPKVNKMDIDPQVLEDAFFIHQTKPILTTHGETYHEGKEFEDKFKHIIPGKFSSALLAALEIETNAKGEPITPPPWIKLMQRYGPPPAYPNLRIPGVNAPLPEGARWGLGPTEWGMPPQDQNGNPLWGNIYDNSTNFQLSTSVPRTANSLKLRTTISSMKSCSVSGSASSASKGVYWGEIKHIDEDFEEESDDIIVYDEKNTEAQQTSHEILPQVSMEGHSLEESMIDTSTTQLLQKRDAFIEVDEIQTSIASDQKIGSSHVYNLPQSTQTPSHLNSESTAAAMYKQIQQKHQQQTVSTNTESVEINVPIQELDNLSEELLLKKYQEALLDEDDDDDDVSSRKKRKTTK